MEDIEDTGSDWLPYAADINGFLGDTAFVGGRNFRNGEVLPKVTVKRRAKRREKALTKETHQDYNNREETGRDSNIPGVGSVFVKTWGCSHNNSDSEYMAGQLASYGYSIVKEADEAQLWLLNSCTVKSPAESHFRNMVESALASGRKVVVAGCVSQASPHSDYLKGVSIVGVQQIDRVVEVVEETLKGHTVRFLATRRGIGGKKAGGARLDLPKIRKNPLIEILAINTGCLNQCTYCKTKHARGDLGSYSPDDLEARVRQSFAEGVKEVWLTSEDTGAYGKDIGVSLTDLLWRLVAVIPPEGRLRLGMTNPPYIKEYLEEIAVILRHPRVYSFLHIPVQSGSDAVLSDMKREYCVADFTEIVDFLREKVPGITIATDLICGFPTESESDFLESLALLSHYRFPSVFINQFYPRPGTPAANMQQIDGPTKKMRTKRMTELFHSYTTFESSDRVGRLYDVLVTEESFDGRFYVGHNKCYEQVLVPKVPGLLGQIVRVRIHSTSKFSMRGSLVNVWTRKQIALTSAAVVLACSLCYIFVKHK